MKALKEDNTFRALVQDSLPDFFSFAFSSLRKIGNEYGVSPEMNCAVKLVDEVIAKSIEEMKELYGEKNFEVQVIVLNTDGEKVSEEVEGRLKKVLPAGLVARSSISQYYPNIYLTESVATPKKEKLCNSVSQALSDLDVEAVCMPDAFALNAESMRVLQTTRAATNDTTSEAATFQIILWSRYIGS